MLKVKSCEEPKTSYVWFFGKRLVFTEGKFMGWYNPKKKSIT